MAAVSVQTGRRPALLPLAARGPRKSAPARRAGLGVELLRQPGERLPLHSGAKAALALKTGV